MTVQELKSSLQKGDFKGVISAINDKFLDGKALKNNEKHELYYLKAVAQRYLGSYQEAIETTQHLLSLTPGYGRGYQELGYNFQKLSELERAIGAFQKAVALNSALVSSWQQLINLYRTTNHSGLVAAQGQLTNLSKLPKPLLGAMDLMYEGKLYKAEQLCRSFVAKHKHHPDGMCLLAEIGAKLKVFDDAEFLLESCVELYPDNQQALAQYINLLSRLGKFTEAKAQATTFLEKFKQPSEGRYLVQATLAHCLVSLGEVQAGISIYLEILAQQPSRAGIHVRLGDAYKTCGDFEQAVSCYQQAHTLRKDYGDAYWSLANSKTYTFTEAELDNMKAALDNPYLEEEDRIHISFALGKAYEDTKQFALSYQYYAQGNALKRASIDYQASRTSELIDHQIKYCDKGLFEAQADKGYSDPAPIFIVGLPRAGSTLLEQIIASHSQVDGTMELHNIMAMVLKLRGRIASGEPLYPKNLSQLDVSQLKALGQKYIDETQSYRQGAAYFIDKMPNNFMHIGLIKLILPNAKIIDARREAMACCFSGFKQLFGEGHEFSYNQTDIAQYYRDYERLMAHWETVLPGQVLKVQHEELVNDFEAQVRKILAYCNLPFEQSCLEFYKTKRNVHTPSAQQVRAPISKSGLLQWKNYTPYLGELKHAL
ncbi:hypothetical protein C1E24_04210 [Pseudoalteromonas phenolica]|uniref:Sulfotransferase family protein n=1 Tax=Pseudoalteromonas phenolica TaxID=161398 RepID=A0A5R9Q4D6_9GAMM|nr:tetratricopeptide repeat-containing sulfotransferase family protein [Pseudoalteromonas phenolica]TLX48013.1 hypothetical protein C1E24_04210 [Pseudoalteromonas phenolica]